MENRMTLSTTLEMLAPEQADANGDILARPGIPAKPIKLNIDKEVALLRQMTVNGLRVRYAEIFGEETRVRHKQWLIRRIAWRMQALSEGDLSERARQRAAELANDADLRTTAPKSTKTAPFPVDCAPATMLGAVHDRRLPMPGATIARQYKGKMHIVRVRPHGFEFEGETYKSLSAVAKKITGTHCNGYFFFRLGGNGGPR
jgi:hypothetical protein